MQALARKAAEGRWTGGPAVAAAAWAAAVCGALVCAAPPGPDREQFRALPVELVIGGSMGQNGSARAGGAAAAGAAASGKRAAAGRRQSQGNPAAAKMNSRPSCGPWRNSRSPDTALPNADVSTVPGGGGGGDGEGNYALKDFIRAQILRRWLPDLSIPGARNMPVAVRMRLLKSGVIDDVAILDQAAHAHRQGVSATWRCSARDAALLASPIQIPGMRFEKNQTLTIMLDPKVGAALTLHPLCVWRTITHPGLKGRKTWHWEEDFFCVPSRLRRLSPWTTAPPWPSGRAQTAACRKPFLPGHQGLSRSPTRRRTGSPTA